MAGQGFRFTARARVGPLFVTDNETYAERYARSQVRLLGLLPMVTKTGADLNRSARSRLVVESVWLPSTFLPDRGVNWEQGAAGEVNASVPVDGDIISADLRVDDDGALCSLEMQRWSDLTEDSSSASIPFAAQSGDERSFGSYTIPSSVTGSWWAGTDRQFDFFRARVDDALFRP